MSLITWAVLTTSLSLPVQAQKPSLLFQSDQADIRALAFSPNSRMLATGGYGQIVIWDVATRKKVLVKKVDGNRSLGTIAFSSNGQFFAAGDNNGYVEIWKLDKGPQLKKHLYFLGDAFSVSALRFSPDSKLLATTGSTDFVRLFDVQSGKRLAKMEGDPNGTPVALAFHPSGKLLASSGYSERIFLWDVAKRKKTGELSSPRTTSMSIEFSPDGRTLAANSIGYVKDHQGPEGIVLWDVKRRQIRSSIKVFAARINYSAEGKYLIYGTFGGGTRVWNLVTGKIERVLNPDRKPKDETDDIRVRAIACSPDGNWVASASGWPKSELRLWNVSNLD